ncbi:hypothetical protein PM8797T_29438 [Gimesia maris DSM 8797]|nr:hypothetical protein PM8797T_29438 [Gimesia maris DSM 8797]
MRVAQLACPDSDYVNSITTWFTSNYKDRLPYPTDENPEPLNAQKE